MPTRGRGGDGCCARAAGAIRLSSEAAASVALNSLRSMAFLPAISSHLHAGMIGHLLHIHGSGVIAARRGPGTDALHVERQLHLAGLLEFDGDRQLVALLELALEVEHHQMISARRQFYA